MTRPSKRNESGGGVMEDSMEFSMNEYGGCELKLRRIYRKGRGNSTQTRKHTQIFNIYHEGLGLAIQILKARLDKGPEFPCNQALPDERLSELISLLELESL